MLAVGFVAGTTLLLVLDKGHKALCPLSDSVLKKSHVASELPAISQRAKVDPLASVIEGEKSRH